MAASRRRDLVIVRAGPRSLHPGWVKGEAPAFDLLVTAFDPTAPHAENEIRVDLPGTKVAGFGRLFAERPDLVSHYDRVALIDDDIETDARTINACFQLGSAYGLEIWQPALTKDSYFTYAMTVVNRWTRVRYSDFVEMMCPFFTARALSRAMPLFASGAETGIDMAWSRHPEVGSLPCGVIDEVTVRHTRPVGSNKTAQGFAADEPYTAEVVRLLQRYGLSFSYPKVQAAVFRAACRPSKGLALHLSHADILTAVFSTPHTAKYILRSLYHYAKRPK